MTSQALRQQARAAFLRGRARESLGALALASPLVLVALLLAEAPLRAAVFGALLLAASVLFSFLGRDAGRVVVPSLLLGTLPLACSLLGPRLGHVCTGSACVSLCVPLCTSGGLAAGIMLARYASAQPRPLWAWLFGASITASAGMMGCACVGVPGAAGMVLGLVVPLLAARLAGAIRRRAR